MVPHARIRLQSQLDTVPVPVHIGIGIAIGIEFGVQRKLAALLRWTLNNNNKQKPGERERRAGG